MAKVFNLTSNPIYCHAFNADASHLAISANSNDVHIFKVPSNPNSNNKYEILSVLSQHTSTVTGLDWAPKSNRIVSCSIDRNSFVWTQQSDGNWKPTLVFLQISHAAICASWSPLENKFAVGSGSKSFTVCFFDNENDWWVSKHIKKGIQSSVTAIDWHPDNMLIACGCSDFKIRVFSAQLSQAGDGASSESAWGSKMAFGSLLFEGSSSGGGWVHGVSFSADGSRLAAVGHDSSISVAQAGGPVVTLRHDFLPFTCVSWIGASTLLVGGHDCAPLLFEVGSDPQQPITYKANLDSSNSSGGTESDGKISAKNYFKQMAELNVSEKSGGASSKSGTLHANTINQIRIVKGTKGGAISVSTIGREGSMILWNLQSICQKLGNLKIQ